MIQTSYFSNLRYIEKEQYVSIARGEPKWYEGPSAKYLAPTWEMQKIEDEEEFKKVYIKRVLEGIGAKKIVKNLDGWILLCWEIPGVFCHRRVLAEWVESECGIIIPEWVARQEEGKKVEEEEIKEDLQLALF